MNPESNADLLVVDSLFCERDERELFKNLSFALAEGEILLVSGPNGSGKTTLLRALAGLSSRHNGEIYWRGVPRRRNLAQFRSEVLYLGHEPGIKLALTPIENLRWLASLSPNCVVEKRSIRDALSRMRIDDYADTPCRYLSAGQRRRVALARLITSNSVVWILDEPLTAIDAAGASEIETLLRAHANSGGAAVLTTHQELSISGEVRKLALGGS